MRRMPWVILVVVALVAVVTGCSREPHYDSRLVAADSLMQADPDSALAIIEAVNPGSLIDNGNQACRDLLLTQARYKCYITATSDSDITRALDYYRHHSGEREKLTRAYIYKGAVMEELGHPDSAMLYYKQAEAVVDTSDFYNLGYTNLRIAELYQSHYANDSAVVARMKKAYGYFVKTGDSAYCVTALGTQGCFSNLIGEDSAIFYLEKAINLGERVNSPKRFLYQSKLAGLHFYAGNYSRAKDLAMKIFWKGRELCDENQYYYYAVRAYIHLGCLDSARWLMALIPPPVNAVDSMNHFKSLAELSLATHQYDDYGQLNEIAVKIDTRISGEARKSALHQEELKWDFRKHNENVRSAAKTKLYTMIAILLLVSTLLLTVFYMVVRRKGRKYQNELVSIRQELDTMLQDMNEKVHRLQSELSGNKKELNEKDRELSDMNKRYQALESKYNEADLSSQVSKIVRYRLAALKELNEGIRVKSGLGHSKISVPLVSLIKDLYNDRKILHSPPKSSFWDNLKLSVDGEFMGIATFVEQKYPSLTVNENHLFWLMCAGVSNQLIRICLNYTNDVTISKKKKKLLKVKMGLDMKVEDYIKMYLQGNTK